MWEIEIKAEISAENHSRTIAKRLSLNCKKTAKLDGFRPGKVPQGSESSRSMATMRSCAWRQNALSKQSSPNFWPKNRS